jgi:hypothetical protein
VINDWYGRMMLEETLTELWLAKGDLTQAQPEAECFLALTLATAAYLAGSRLGNQHPGRHGGTRPRARSELYRPCAVRDGRLRSAARCLATMLKLANSRADDDPLRGTFLSAPSVREIVGPEREPQRDPILERVHPRNPLR